jgi:hypothetical protein
MFLHTISRSRIASLLLASMAIASSSLAETWKKANPAKVNSTFTRYIKPVKAQIFELDEASLKAEFESCPEERTGNIKHYGKIISLPMPDGSTARFAIVSYSMMEPALAAKWSFAQTYTGQGIDNPAATLKADFTTFGFHYQVLSPQGSFYADPVFHGDKRFIQVYDKKDLRVQDKAGHFACSFGNDVIDQEASAPGPSILASSGATRRTYRLALAATAEYTSFHSGVTGAASAMVTTVNRVTGVYEVDLAVRFVLVANNEQLIYTNANSDPYANTNGGTMLGQNQTNITNLIGSANYDIGHVFSTGGGGIAGLGVVCNSSQKARGVTGSPSPVADAFDIDYVAHEMGHQFGGNHTFNSQSGSCGGGNRSTNSAYEPGSGTTIMAYAGICGADDLQNNSNAYFVFKSYEEITTFITNNNSGGSCPVKVASGNTPPAIPAIQGGYTIPISTPFKLTAPLVTDAEGDALTYCWEQSDLGTAGAPGSTVGPIIRSWSPVVSRERIVPRVSNLLAGNTVIGEKLPTVARTMSFKLLVRDNFAGSGGANQGSINFSVNATGGAFSVSGPNTNTVIWEGGTSQTVTWVPGSTASAPFNTPFVRIKLSTDGGNTFPYTLADSTQNDGTATIDVPVIATTSTQCRVMVEGLNNIFFDVSNANFRVNPPSTASLPMSLISAPQLCAGQSFKVAFSINDNTVYNAGNVFSIRLSDAAGAFGNPLTVGSVTATSADTILVTLPASLAAGTGYKLKITSTNPARTGAINLDAPDVNSLASQPASITGPLNVCEGNTCNYSVPAQAGTTGFSWTLPAGCQFLSSNADSSNISILFTGNGGELSVSAKNNCGKGLSKTISLSPTQILPATVTSTASSLNPCLGTTVSFTATAVNGGLSPQYQWMKNNTPIAGATAQTYSTATLATGDKFNVILVSSLTCGALNADTSSEILMTVILPRTPAATIESDAQADTACIGIPVTFLSTINTNGGSSPAYAWFKNTTQIGGQNQSTLTVSNLANGDSVRLRLTVTGNCLTSNVVFSPAIRIAIVTLTSNAGVDTTVCPGSSVQLKGRPAGGTWSGNNVVGSGVFTAPNSGSSLLTYTVNKYGCSKTDLKVVSVFQIPNVTFTINTDTLKGNATGATAWAWYLNGNIIQGANSQKLTILESGEYCCEATFGNGCSKKSLCQQVTFSSVSVLENEKGFNVWPNPVNGLLNIRWNGKASKIKLYNAEGKVMVSLDAELLQGNANMNMENLPTGMYRLVIRKENGSSLGMSLMHQ